MPKTHQLFNSLQLHEDDRKDGDDVTYADLDKNALNKSGSSCHPEHVKVNDHHDPRLSGANNEAVETQDERTEYAEIQPKQ